MKRLFYQGFFCLAAVLFAVLGTASPPRGASVQARIDADLAAGKPLVAHVAVALCDNANQGIVPVPPKLGNGQDPQSNLYWGALYGVKTHLIRNGWRKVTTQKPDDGKILERIVLARDLPRGDGEVPVYLIADAWDGAEIRSAMEAFLSAAAGEGEESLLLGGETTPLEIDGGGGAHLLAYVGHNGLMELELPLRRSSPEGRRPRSAIVLACASKPYFLPRLESNGAHPLLLTTGLMAPGAYTLDAAIQSWIRGGTATAVRESAAAAYHRYQKCGLKAARGLFWGAP